MGKTIRLGMFGMVKVVIKFPLAHTVIIFSTDEERKCLIDYYSKKI